MFVFAVLHLCAAYVHCTKVGDGESDRYFPCKESCQETLLNKELPQALASRKCEAASQGAMIVATRSNPMPARRPGADIQYFLHAASPVRA